jgi:hypothetical protein
LASALFGPNIENEDPMRAKFLKLNDDPSDVKSNAEMQLPTRANERTEVDDATCMALNKETP